MDSKIILEMASEKMLAQPEYRLKISDEDMIESVLYRAGLTDPEMHGPLSGNLGNKNF